MLPDLAWRQPTKRFPIPGSPGSGTGGLMTGGVRHTPPQFLGPPAQIPTDGPHPGQFQITPQPIDNGAMGFPMQAGYGIDPSMPISPVPRGYARGVSRVPGHYTGRDTVRSMLAPGEAVLNEVAASQPGVRAQVAYLNKLGLRPKPRHYAKGSAFTGGSRGLVQSDVDAAGAGTFSEPTPIPGTGGGIYDTTPFESGVPDWQPTTEGVIPGDPYGIGRDPNAGGVDNGIDASGTPSPEPGQPGAPGPGPIAGQPGVVVRPSFSSNPAQTGFGNPLWGGGTASVVGPATSTPGAPIDSSAPSITRGMTDMLGLMNAPASVNRMGAGGSGGIEGDWIPNRTQATFDASNPQQTGATGFQWITPQASRASLRRLFPMTPQSPTPGFWLPTGTSTNPSAWVSTPQTPAAIYGQALRKG